MIVERDMEVIKFLEEFKVAKTSTLEELIYKSYRVTARRLAELTEKGAIKRERGGWSSEYYYYLKKPKQLRHSLLLTDFYRELHKIAEIHKFVPEPTYGDIRPDGVVGYTYNGINYLALIEVEISHKGFDSEKYENFIWEKYLRYKPELIVITDQKCECKKFKPHILSTKLDLLPPFLPS